jgi:type VI secretion system protein ImpH
MVTKERRTSTHVKDRLFDEWYKFSFFSAVYLLETFSPEMNKLGTAMEPQKEAVRFTVKPGFSFPASDIANLTPGAEDGPASMEVSFMGLLGPSGTLPHWYNTLAMERLRAKDSALTAFLDLFHHRLLSLFYLAWKKHQFPVNFLPGAKDKLSGYLLSLCGLGTPKMTGRIGFAEESLSFYSGLLARMAPSSSSISGTVAHFSGTDASVEQFVERTIALAAGDLSHLGQANSRLGRDLTLGQYVWECQTKFRVRLGPMSLQEYIRLMPTGDMHEPTFSLVRYLVGIEYEFEISLCLKREEAPPCILGRSPGCPETRLGWSTWLKSPAFNHPEDLCTTFQESGTLYH